VTDPTMFWNAEPDTKLTTCKTAVRMPLNIVSTVATVEAPGRQAAGPAGSRAGRRRDPVLT
jgi:hypothetical protein